MSNKFKPVEKPLQPPKPSRRPLLWAVAGSVAVLAIVAAVFWALQARPADVTYTPEVTSGPNAAIDQTQFDYGDVKLGTTIETTFRVKNTGSAQLAFRGEPRVEVLEGC